jgi:hypothetical protein
MLAAALALTVVLFPGPWESRLATAAVVKTGAAESPSKRSRQRAGPKNPKRAHPKTVEALAVLSDPLSSPALREAAVRTLAFDESAAVESVLTRALLEDPSLRVRFLAARALEHRKEGAGALAQALSVDPAPPVRRAAARALGHLGDGGTRQEPALVAALGDPETRVVLEAAAALRKVGSRASRNTLAALAAAQNREIAAASTRALAAIDARTVAREERKRRAREVALFKAQPHLSTPLMHRVLRYGGTVHAVGSTAALGAAMGAVVPLMIPRKQGVSLWLLSAPLGAVAGAAAGLGYSALRRFDFPVTDAVLISLHGASGFVAGVGYGLWLGKKAPDGTAGALGILGGCASLLASAGASPWLKSRPSTVLGAGSGGFLGGAVALLAAGAVGYDALQKPELALGVSFVGQGVGTALGTVGAATLPITSMEWVLVDLGAVVGGTMATGLSIVALAIPRTGMTVGMVNGAVLAGVLAGAGAGGLLGALLPAFFESRLSLHWPADLPVQLMPGLPTPTVQPQSGKLMGAWVPLLQGSFW